MAALISSHALRDRKHASCMSVATFSLNNSIEIGSSYSGSNIDQTIFRLKVQVMIFLSRSAHKAARRFTQLSLMLVISLMHTGASYAQVTAGITERESVKRSSRNEIFAPDTSVATDASEGQPITPTVAIYFDPLQGASSLDLVRRALTSNGELGAARLDVGRARARLLQAGLRPNPAIDFEQTTGRLTGSAGEGSTSVGLAVPF